MSFALTYSSLRNPAFIEGMRTLINLRGGVPTKTVINITKLYKICEDELKLANNAFDSAIEPFLVKDEKTGKPLAQPGMQPGTFKVIDGKADELNAKVEEFGKQSFTIDRPKIKLKEVVHALSPKEIMALQDLWEPYDEKDL